MLTYQQRLPQQAAWYPQHPRSLHRITLSFEDSLWGRNDSILKEPAKPFDSVRCCLCNFDRTTRHWGRKVPKWLQDVRKFKSVECISQRNITFSKYKKNIKNIKIYKTGAKMTKHLRKPIYISAAAVSNIYFSFEGHPYWLNISSHWKKHSSKGISL